MFLKLPHIFLEAAKEFVRDRCEQLAGAVAFFELLSAAPLAAFFYLVFTGLPGPENIQQQLSAILETLFNPQVTEVLKMLYLHLENEGKEELLALSISGLIGLLISTTGFYGQIKDSLETIWNERREQVSVKDAFKRRFEDLKISMIGTGIIFLFLAFRIYVWNLLPFTENPIFRTGFQLVFLTALHFYFFAFLPPVKFKRTHALPGAMLAAVLLLAGKQLFDHKMLVKAGFDVNDVAQNLIVLLLWFYFAASIRLYCAQFSKVYTELREGFKVMQSDKT